MIQERKVEIFKLFNEINEALDGSSKEGGPEQKKEQNSPQGEDARGRENKEQERKKQENGQ